MFSGISNQVTSLFGKKQEGDAAPKEETAEVPPAETSPTDAEGKKTASGGGGKLEMIGNTVGSVKSQMSSWLGGGLLKGSGEPVPAETQQPAQSPPKESPPAEQPAKDDDDASSATGGADSDAQLSDASPTEENQPTQMGAVSTKAIAGAKTLGNMLYSGFSKASKTVSEASSKIKKKVEETGKQDPQAAIDETSILGELNKEQEAFIAEKTKAAASGAAAPPWAGRPNEESLKAECLSLSTNRRNFLRAPPAGAEFPFVFDDIYPVAMATLAADPNLEKMRFDLVPKVINEENFWRNYFYRVSLICQANDVSSMAAEAIKIDSGNAAKAEEMEKERDTDLDNYEMIYNDDSSISGKKLDVPIEDSLLDSSDIEDLK